MQLKKFINKNLLAILFFTIGLAFNTNAQKVNYKNQDRGELEKQRSLIMQEIKETQSKLSVLQKDKNATMAQLNALQTKLNARQALITNINKDIAMLENNIHAANNDVQSLTLNLSELKKQYAQLIRYTYKNRTSQSVLMFLFSSKSFNDAVRRYNYVKQYREYRKQQAEKIIATSTTLQNRISELNQQKKQKDLMLNAQVEQQNVLASESKQKNAVVLTLKGQEKELIASIISRKKTADAVNSAINTAIKREIALARKKAEEERKRLAMDAKRARENEKAMALAKKQEAETENKRLREETEKAKNLKTISSKKSGSLTTSNNNVPSPKKINNNYNPKLPPTEIKNNTASPSTTASSTYNNDLSTESRALSNSFEQNKGILNSPVSGGYVSSHFGKNKHPVFNVVEENYGVDIRTGKGAKVHPVFSGNVSTIFPVSGEGFCVMIDHGNYFSVYRKIDNITVSKGQKVTPSTIIGSVITDADGNNQVHFEIWKVSASGAPVRINPEQWIRL